MPPTPTSFQGFNSLSILGTEYQSYIRALLEQRLIAHLGVFALLFTAIKLNQYLFFHFNTNPAVLFIPTGIALGAVYLFGNRALIPIACAWFLGSLTSPSQAHLLTAILFALAYTLQSFFGGYLLTRFKFSGTMEHTRDALCIIGVALLLPSIAPSITTLVGWFAGSLTASVWESWSRAWAGGVVNILILTPLITSWSRYTVPKESENSIERIMSLLLLILVTYLTFWTTVPHSNTFLILYFLLTVLLWIGLRLHPRFVTLSLFLITVFGMFGSIASHSTAVPLNQQLLADELFVILIAPIFLILSALVEQGRQSAEESEARAQALEAVNRKLSFEDQAKSEFLATLAHELRNPLAPVVSSLELLKIELLQRNESDLIQLIEVADAHNLTLTRLLDDLLDVARISRKKFKLQKTVIELHSVIELAKRTVAALYESRSHTLSLTVSSEKMWVLVDPLRLEQILINLLNNAAKYTLPGGHITLSIKNVERGLHIRIKDNGIGLELPMRNKIFEPFIQSDDRSQGLGIGLSLTKRLVELHGGEIWAESEGLGKGSEFVVVLPDVQSAQVPLAVPEQRRRNDPQSSAEIKTRFDILIVDDNEAAAQGLGKLLEHSGHSISLAYDGIAAIEKMKTKASQIVLLDIGMPDMDGYEVATRLRQMHEYNSVVLIALTGYGQLEDKKKAEHAGFNYHVTKPVSIVDIEDILTNIRYNTTIV